MNKNTTDCDCNNPKDQARQNCNCEDEQHHSESGHNHDHEHDHQNCEHDHHNCEHDHDHGHREPQKIYLTLMDDSKLECDVIDIFEIRGESYIALLPSDSETAMLFGFTEDEQGPHLRKIETDEEYEAASKGFMERQEA